MTFIELHNIASGLVIRVNLEHISSYFPREKKGTMLMHLNGEALEVGEEPTYIDGKIHEIEEWRMNARNRT